jgi:aspartyl-tRNA(Asn)/glutamyl-tRNA(Gln) amidotransferase subunit B
VLDEKTVSEAKRSLPELPPQKIKRLINDYKINEYDAKALAQDKAFADYFEQCAKLYNNPKAIVNWLCSDIAAAMNAKSTGIDGLALPAANLIQMLKMIDEGAISGKMAKDLLLDMIETGRSAREIADRGGLRQISDDEAIRQAARKVLGENPKAVEDYKNGKSQAVVFLVGQLMRYTKGAANPAVANKILKEELR